MSTEPTPRTAVITGAGSRRGIGRATAHALASAGYHIAVLDLDKETAEDTAREISARHAVEAMGLVADVTDAHAVDAAIGAVEAALPPVGALVNNAGITSPTRFLDVTPTEWDRILDVNVRGSFLVTHRVAAGMAERRFGRIVFLSSVSAERGGGVFGGGLLGGQGRSAGLRQGARPRTRPVRSDGQLRRPRPDRHRHHPGQAGRGAQGGDDRGCSGRPHRRGRGRGRMSSLSWPGQSPATSPA